MNYKIPTSFGAYLDFVSILEIKRDKGIVLPAELITDIELAKRLDVSIKDLYDHLRHVNEMIWWCMDKQRCFTPESRKDRAEIGMIVAELNDVRDSIKKQINHVCNEKTSSEEKKWTNK